MAAAGKFMRGIMLRQTGGPRTLSFETNIPIPEPKENEVQVRLAAAGINYIDTYFRTGLYPHPMPAVLGREGAGVVSKLGANVKDLEIGARVCFQGVPGAYAEYVTVPAASLIPVPAGVPLKTAAGCLLQGMTAHYLTCSTFFIKPGDDVLVHAGAGGTGGMVVQMAKMRGARVIATVGSEEKMEVAKSLGADHVINYTKTDFQPEVMAITGKGVNVVYDGVGKDTWEGSLKSLRPLGMLVLFGNASGAVPPIDPLLLSKNGSLFLTRPTLANYAPDAAAQQARAKDLLEWMTFGQVTVRIAKTFALEDAASAHEALESRGVSGKILLDIAPEIDEVPAVAASASADAAAHP